MKKNNNVARAEVKYAQATNGEQLRKNKASEFFNSDLKFNAQHLKDCVLKGMAVTCSKECAPKLALLTSLTQADCMDNIAYVINLCVLEDAGFNVRNYDGKLGVIAHEINNILARLNEKIRQGK